MKSFASHDWQLILDRVQETRLSNGLRLLVLPKSGTGSVVCDIYYGGGSSADPTGRFGLTHFLEHMLYNGTKRVPHGHLDHLILQIAGQHNAETGPDYTHFWCHVPKQGLELVLALEADRMTGACLGQEDVDRERPIILEEEARYREQPFDELMTKLMATIYEGHPYAHPTIGSPADLHRITRDDLVQHYHRMFQPSNAVMVVTGDLAPARTISLVEKHFGRIAPTHEPLGFDLIKPPSVKAFSATRITHDADEIVPRGVMLWPAPGPFDMTARPWGVAAAVMGSGRASRLWQALVEETQLAAFVSVSLSEERLGGYLMVEMELNPDADYAAAELLVHESFEKLARLGPTDDELKRVARQRAASARWARQQAVTLAGSLGTWSLFSDWHLLSEAWRLDDLVTHAQVQEVAQKVGRNNLISGWTIPQKNASDVQKPSTSVANRDENQPTLTPEQRLDTNKLDRRFRRMADRAISQPSRYKPRSRPLLREMPQGTTLLAESLTNQGVSAIELRWRTGWLQETLPGIATITARMCEETIHQESGLPIGEWLESQGAGLDSSASGFSIQGRMEDFEAILSGLYQLVAAPQWTDEMFDRVVRRVTTELEADLDDPAYHAELLLKRMVYAGGPGSEDARGTIESLNRMTIQMVRQHHATYYQPRNAIMGLAGDWPTRSLIGHWVRPHLKNWQRSIKQPEKAYEPEFDYVQLPLNTGKVMRMRSPGVQTHVVMGHRTIARSHPDWIALQILEIIIGAGPGMTDQLGRRLRDELGLVYSVNMAMTEGAWRSPGYLRIGFSCDPADARQAEQETIKILQQAASGALSDRDCDEARNYLVNSWNIGLESAEERLSTWLDMELYGWDLTLPPVWIRDCQNLTNDQIRAAAERWILPSKLQIVRYGPK